MTARGEPLHRRSRSRLALLVAAALFVTLLGSSIPGADAWGAPAPPPTPSERECRPYIEKALKEIEGTESDCDGADCDTASKEASTEDDGGGESAEGAASTEDEGQVEESNDETESKEGETAEDETKEASVEEEEVTETQATETEASPEDGAGSQEEAQADEAQDDTKEESVEDAPAESTEEAAGSQEEAAASQEEAAGSQEEGATGSTEEAAGSQEEAAGSQEEAAGSQEEAAGSQEEGAAGSTEEAAGSQEEGAAGSQEEGAGSQEEGAAGSQKEAAGSQEDGAAGSQEESGAGSQEEAAGSQEEEAAGSVEEEAAAGSHEEAGAESKEEGTEEAGAESKEETKEESAEEAAESKEETKEESAEGAAESKEDTKEESAEGAAAESAEETKEASAEEAGADSKEDTKEESAEAAGAESAEDAQKESAEGDAADSKEKESVEEAAAESQEAKEGSDEDTKEAESTEAGESAENPEEDLIMEIEVPENLRPREHIAQILKLDPESAETEMLLQKTVDVTLRELKRLYDSAIKPLEILYKYRDLSNRHFGDPEIFSKPLILFMGPWSGGKSTIINYLLGTEFTPQSLRTGAEPSPAYFNILMHGERYEVLDGTQLAADWTFSGLQKFGQGLLDRLRGVRLNNPLLEKVNIVEIPGILEIRKQVERVFPFNDACQWFIDRADIIFLVYDPSKLDVGPETEAILDQLKGREYQTRIILNKADQVKPEELMRVQGTLIWNISPLMSSAEPPVMYSTSLWSMPYESGAPLRLLSAQEKAFLRDLRQAFDRRVENKIASARRFAVRVRNHAKMVDCYLTTYYNHKSFFGNKKKVSDDIIDHPQDYHIYEGLSTLTNISRYDLPDPDSYRDFFRLNPLFEFQQLAATCTYFRGCPINRLDVAIAYDLPELVGKYKKTAEDTLESTSSPTNGPPNS